MEERTRYAGQPVGLVVAKDRDTAVRAAQMVMVGYEDIRQPILTIKDALAEGGRDELPVNFFTGKAEGSVLGDPEGVSYSGGKVDIHSCCSSACCGWFSEELHKGVTMVVDIDCPRQSILPLAISPSHFVAPSFPSLIY